MNNNAVAQWSNEPPYEEMPEASPLQLEWFSKRLLAFDWDYALSDDPVVWEYGLRMQEQLFGEATKLGIEALTMYFQVLGYPSLARLRPDSD